MILWSPLQEQACLKVFILEFQPLDYSKMKARKIFRDFFMTIDYKKIDNIVDYIQSIYYNYQKYQLELKKYEVGLGKKRNYKQNNWNDMILVIGASGFIGNYLIDDLINNGYEVFATCRNDAALQYFKTKKIKCCYLDISDKHSFDKLPSKQIEAVILLAALYLLM